MQRVNRSLQHVRPVPVDTIAPDHKLPTGSARAAWARLAKIAASPPLAWALKLGLSAGLIALVCHHIDGAALADRFVGQSPMWIGATALIGLLQIGILTLRWQQILKGLGAETRIGSLLAVTYMGCFFGAFLLGPTGGDVARAMLAPPRSFGRKGIVHSVLFERLATVAGLGLVTAPLVALATGTLARTPALLIALALVPLPFLGVAIAAWLARATAGRTGALFVALRELDHSRRRLCRTWPRFAAAVALAATGQLLVAAEAWCLSQAQHLGVPFLDFAILMPPVMLVVALPISLGGWGVREGAMVAALALVGVGATSALLLSVEIGLLATLVSLPGGALWLGRCLGRPTATIATGG